MNTSFQKTVEDEIEEDEHRITACNILIDRIENKLKGWRFILIPFYINAINRIKKEYWELCEESWLNTEYLMKQNCPVHGNCNCGR